ncbi:hypothetical protein B0E38_01803 [Streptomyces sp. 111WW2]|uniref:hypothetical protein n=1 Tax=Streptomyces sp. 111WW2 TaxID=1945515 RepID=UPI000D0C83A8|nr:hypothetical protein [Streptomyces sp. 111WW2]PSK57958.1 hypothetical protein B0E38_01803 [Streptomyces sp. 111WW2]
MARELEYTVHDELVDMHLDGGLDQQAAEDGAARICACYARELAAVARASGETTAEDIARFLEAHAAKLDRQRSARA